MNKLLIGLGIAAVAAAIAIIMNPKDIISKIRKKLKHKEIYPVKTIEGKVNFQDIVAWFKSLSLDKNKDVPFIAKATELKDMLNYETKKNAALFVGVFNEEKNEIIHAQIIEADSFDDKILEVLGNEAIVVLN
ncbi:MAG: hypothetical protein J6U84_03415 [Bacteroidales bacterium]|nr:hypothetical protein [Bacteroidales bacterium]